MSFIAGWLRIWARNLPPKGTKVARNLPLTSGYLWDDVGGKLEQLHKCKWFIEPGSPIKRLLKKEVWVKI